MSHEFLDYDNDSDYGWGDSITSTNYKYFYVPSIPEWAYSEFDGLLYEGTQYNWEEVDYRLSVDYNIVPEPAEVGLFMGLVFAGFILYKILEGKGINRTVLQPITSDDIRRIIFITGNIECVIEIYY